MTLDIYDSHSSEQLDSIYVETWEGFEASLLDLFNYETDVTMYISGYRYGLHRDNSAVVDFCYSYEEIEYNNKRGETFMYRYPDEVDEAISDITLDFKNDLI